MRRVEGKAFAQLGLHGRQDAADGVVAVAGYAVAPVVDRDQVSDLVVFVLAGDDGLRALARRLRQQAADGVVLELTDQRASRARDHPVRHVAFDVRDEFAVEADRARCPSRRRAKVACSVRH